MRSYRIMPHTADLRINIQGDDLSELFRAGFEGMTEYMAPGVCKSEGQGEGNGIRISSIDSSALLVDFLSEVLTLMHTKKSVFCNLEIIKLGDDNLEAKIRGFFVGQFERDIKAVTYHGVDIKKNEAGLLETDLVFDI